MLSLWIPGLSGSYKDTTPWGWRMVPIEYYASPEEMYEHVLAMEEELGYNRFVEGLSLPYYHLGEGNDPLVTTPLAHGVEKVLDMVFGGR